MKKQRAIFNIISGRIWNDGEIRRQIAEANDVEFVTSEFRYQGDCAGTCP